MVSSSFTWLDRRRVLFRRGMWMTRLRRSTLHPRSPRHSHEGCTVHIRVVSVYPRRHLYVYVSKERSSSSEHTGFGSDRGWPRASRPREGILLDGGWGETFHERARDSHMRRCRRHSRRLNRAWRESSHHPSRVARRVCAERPLGCSNTRATPSRKSEATFYTLDLASKTKISKLREVQCVQAFGKVS